MPCALGCPKTKCPFNHEGLPTRKACGACKHFEVPKHIEQHCQLWDRDRILCLKPKSECATCHECVVREAGRPVSSSHDFATKEGRAAYAKEWRANNKEKDEAARARFKKAHPNYWKEYRAKKKAGTT